MVQKWNPNKGFLPVLQFQVHDEVWHARVWINQLDRLAPRLCQVLHQCLTINEKDAFQCTDCGPRPKVLVINGIAIGIQKGELEQHKDIVVKDLPRKSKKQFSSSCFQERMFIKLPKNRKLLKSAAQKEEWPVLDCHTEPDNHHEVEVAKKRPKLEYDDGMEKFCLFLRTFDRSIKPSRNCLTIMESNNSNNSNNTWIWRNFAPKNENVSGRGWAIQLCHWYCKLRP